ncbi:Putative lumazine-binding [Dyella sp. OK004]|uniref:nuclear transport factor 2 family protein n=1 Tax=Dyella sp. OK004 TaxID=1855292 RepID=UPI0008E3B935|nr:nuclear transport factor 2 family protein [Dyella sp. OK004]SFS06950.1 Putative lumazine-binding [Dyella sp. OK004]
MVRLSSMFRHTAAPLGAALIALMSAAPVHAASPEEQAVLAPFQSILDAIAKRDRNLMRDNLLPGGMVTLKRGDKITQLHFDAFIDHIPVTGTQQLQERIYNPLVKIDDDIAVIWTEYQFFIDGKVDHCGTDIAHLVKRDGRWLVAGIADTQRKDCPAK